MKEKESKKIIEKLRIYLSKKQDAETTNKRRDDRK